MPDEEVGEQSTLLVQKPAPVGTSWSVFLNLTMTAVGASCMALPYTLVAAGYLLGPLLLAFSCFVSALSLAMVSQLSAQTGKKCFTEISEAVLGPAGRIVAALGILFLLLGAGAMFLDISTDILFPFVQPLYSVKLGLRIILATIMALASLPRTLHALRYLSVVGIACLCFILLGVLWHLVTGAQDRDASVGNSPSVRPFKLGLGVVVALNIQLLAYSCHPSVPILYSELPEHSKHQMTPITVGTMGFAFVFYLLMAGAHFHVSGGQPSGDLLEDYPATDTMMTLAKLILSFVLIMKAPLVFHPLLSTFHSILRSPIPQGMTQRSLECAVFYAFLVLLTVLLPDLVTLITCVGSTCGVTVAFILPALMTWVQNGKDFSISWEAILVGICGILIAVIGPFTVGFTPS